MQMLLNRDDKMAEGAIDSRRFYIFDTFMATAVSGANEKNKCTPFAQLCICYYLLY